MKKETLYKFVIGISLAGYAWLGWNTALTYEHHPSPTMCMVKTISGLPCPSCGTTRSLTSLLEGNIAESFLINPFGIFAAIMMVVFPLWVIADYLRRSDSFFRWYGSVERLLTQHRWVAVTSVILIVSNWWWNIEKGL